jgi:hypothetical protein
MFLEGFIVGLVFSGLIMFSFYINYKIKRKKELELQKKKDRILSEALHVYSMYKEISKPKFDVHKEFLDNPKDAQESSL